MRGLRVLCCAAYLALQLAGAAQTEVFPSLRRHGHPHRASKPAAPADTSVPSTPVDVPAALPGTLPAVSEVLGGASESLKSITSQVSSLEVLEPTRMAKAKAVFERKLKAQEDASREVVQANALIEANISSLKAANEELRTKAKSLEEENALMREELSTTESRLGAVKQYITSTLKTADDSEAPELEVLGGAHKKAPKQSHKKRQPHVFTEVSHEVKDVEAKPPQPPTAKSRADDDDDSDDEDDEDDDQDPGLSFMALSSRRAMVSSSAAAESSEALAAQQALAEMDATATLDSSSADAAPSPQPEPPAALAAVALQQPVPAEAGSIDFAAAAETPVSAPVEPDPQQVLAALAKRVTELTKQQKAEETKYSALYKQSAKAGEKRHHALLLQQRQLTATRAALTAMHSRLNDACLHLEATQKELAARLRGLGLFAQRVSHLLLAPEREAAALLAALPKKVTPAVAARPAP